MNKNADMVVLGKISGVFGVKGWVKIYSHTSPIQQIIRYDPIYLKLRSGWEKIVVEKGHKQGKGIVAKLSGIDDRDQAFAMIDTEIGIEREQLPALRKDTYYWSELEGMTVVNTDNVELGKVSWIFNTGSNDVLVVKGEKERMIPWLENDIVLSVDTETQQISVDWDPEF